MSGLLPIRSEMLINGSWVNTVTGSRTRGSEKIVIRDGSSSESTFLTAGSCDFTLNNRDGQFSPGNPNSAYFGKLGRNIQTRNGLVTAKYMRMFGQTSGGLAGTYDGTGIGAPDRAALDITGDIDIRVDIDPQDWHASYGKILISKYRTVAEQRSWALYTTIGGGLQFVWSSDGTSAGRIFSTYSPVAFTHGRGAVRVTLDVDNGSGGYTVTWYTSDTISGTWLQVQQTITTSGTTSIFSSTSDLYIGKHNPGTTPIGNVSPFTGKIYGMSVRSGIAGSVVANFDPSSRTRGDVSWSDGLGTTWTGAGLAAVDDMDYRFWGAVAKLPQRWDTSGQDVFVPTSAIDILGQISGGQKNKNSALYRLINTQYAGPATPAATSQYYTGWWPMESGSSTGGTISAVKGQTGTFSNAAFATWSEMPGAAGCLAFSADTGNASGQTKTISTYSGNTGFSCMFAFQLSSLPASDQVIMRWRHQAGTVFTSTLSAGPTGYTFATYDRSGILLQSTVVGYGGAPPTTPTLMRVSHGGPAFTVVLNIGWIRPGDTVFYGTTDTYASTIGKCIGWDSPGFTGKSGMKLGEVLIQQGDSMLWATTSIARVTSAYAGEDVYSRFARLCSEAGIAWQIRGWYDTADAPTMGAEPIDTAFNLLRDTVDVSGGVVHAAKDFYGLVLRTLGGLAGRRTWAPVLNYTANHFSPALQPDRVTTTIRNVVTASRPNGGERVSIKTSGSLNVNDPAVDPDGAGYWGASITRNVNTDAQLQTQADWDRALGTDDSDRYSSVTVELHRPEFETSPGVPSALAMAIRGLHLGDAFTMSNLPVWMGKQPPTVLIRGRMETLANMTHEITWNAAPYGPYTWGQYSRTGYRYDSSSTTLAAAVGSSATYAKFALGTAQTRWSQVSVPYDVIIAGQQNTVTEVGVKGSLGTADFGGFESGATTGWVGTGGTLTVSTAQKKYGTRSALITVSGSPAQATLRRSSSALYAPVTAGQVYTQTCWLYSSIALTGQFYMVMDWYNGGAFLSTSAAGAINVVAGTWTLLTYSATAPATATLAQYGPTVQGSPPNGTLLYFDGVELAGPDVSFQPVIMTRGVDGITKALSSGDKVHVLDQIRWGRQ